MSPALKSLLLEIRQHAAFEELKSAVEAPAIKPYRPKDASAIEHSRAQWIYESGQVNQHERWLGFLTGQTESQ